MFRIFLEHWSKSCLFIAKILSPSKYFYWFWLFTKISAGRNYVLLLVLYCFFSGRSLKWFPRFIYPEDFELIILSFKKCNSVGRRRDIFINDYRDSVLLFPITDHKLCLTKFFCLSLFRQFLKIFSSFFKILELKLCH